ncbi:serine/threonine-protein kinase [Streptomyces sp. MBT33]|uniref:serine/threonine-protein kinase n=1 Tax=Streptomyces sp. MBT33 TaxID=1488363 RepID=UPI00190ADB71|nr:serine/threonine-protein kinase [Streptomyces sp. MBT33]MBK3643842.1 serine/threonine protein kinase [Streptomyces sp. MBT33]
MHSVERIGRYRLERRLGAGAFGTVWLAHDDELRAPVAVKVLADNWSHRLDVRERFLAEARMLRQAGSQRVVQVHDIGELPDGRPYFVMEYADGGTLADLVAAAPPPVPEALRLTAAAARGAAALHEAGIVHRDIKPSNVLLCSAPGGGSRVLLADLGLAKILAQASGLTQAAGSAGYRPPEQATAGSGIDARADVYSLGALGYHLVTGAVPGEPGRIVRPDRLRPGLDPAVRRALLRALEPDRERRWPTAQAFAEELERLAAPGHRPRPRRGALALAGALAVCATAVAVPLALSDRSPTPPADVRATDATGRVAAEVPRAWGRQLRGSGWDPRVLGLPAGQEPGFVVADDLAKWQDLTADVNGVFVGRTGGGDLTAAVDDLTHPGCHYDGARAYSDAVWHGRVREWSGCRGSGGSVTEAALAPAHGAGRPRVYVQIRERGRATATDHVLTSVHLGN